MGPHAPEIAGNGVDDNCLLGDLADDTLPPIPEFGPAWLTDADLLIISVDALRADRMSLYGYPRQTTPNIDRHFADAYRFREAYAEAISTRDTFSELAVRSPPPRPPLQVHRHRRARPGQLLPGATTAIRN